MISTEIPGFDFFPTTDDDNFSIALGQHTSNTIFGYFELAMILYPD
jgi:hypothetical protein